MPAMNERIIDAKISVDRSHAPAMAVSSLSTSALSSLEAMLNSLTGRSDKGGDETPRDDDVTDIGSPPPLPVRPPPRGRLPSSLPRVTGAATGPWTPPSSPSPRMGDVMVELERKATEAEARLRQKEEENAALRRQIESYHVRWLQYEIKIKSMEEAFHEQMVSLQMARDAVARRAEEHLPYDHRRHGLAESSAKMSEEASARPRRHGSCHRAADARRPSAVGRLGAEFRRQSQAFENSAAALDVDVDVEPWQPGAPSGSSIDDLKKLKSQFRAWKNDYKARLRRTKAEIDRDRRRRTTCWI